MSSLVARILLAILMLPLGAMVYLVAFNVVLDWNSWRWGQPWWSHPFVFAGLITWPVLAAYWWWLWRETVNWTRQRIAWTFAAAAIAMLLSGITAAIVVSLGNDLAAFFAGVNAPLLWLVATVFIWRETDDERRARQQTPGQALVCPECGYSMRGLTEARCPECGSSFTLDELIARQPGAAQTQLEK